MNEVVSLLVVTSAMWLSGYGAAMIAGQHGRYVDYSRRGVYWFGSQVKRGVRWMWRRYRTQIIWMAIGFFLALTLLGKMAHN